MFIALIFQLSKYNMIADIYVRGGKGLNTANHEMTFADHWQRLNFSQNTKLEISLNQ